MRSSTMALACAGLLATSALACTATVRDGVFACHDDTECPSGYRCGGGRCRAHAGGQCRQDIQCDDTDVCTEDVCESGYCTHTPDTAQENMPCYDGSFCDGMDVCRAGVCTNVGSPPCAPCDENLGCSGCGAVGSACCDGAICQGGARCDGASCIACGDATQACCDFDQCNPGLACDRSTGQGICAPCGGSGQPCCTGIFAADSGSTGCNGTGLFCDYSSGNGVCRSCGASGERCCDDGCGAGLFCKIAAISEPSFCVDVSCDPPCAPTTICAPNPGGNGSACIPCGEDDGPCCEGQLCLTSPGSCYQGRCGAFAMPGMR